MSQSKLLLPIAVTVILLTGVSCWASTDTVVRLESDIRSLQTQGAQQVIQQQSAEADVTQRLSSIDEGMQSASQRLSNLEASASKLSTSDAEMQSQLSAMGTKLDELSSEVDERLDDRAINEIFRNPLTYL